MRSFLLAGILLASNHAAAFEFRANTAAPEQIKQNDDIPKNISIDTIRKQRQQLREAAAHAGYGPQSPRDISNWEGGNMRVQTPAPASSKMDLCNIHLHRNAEHKGKDFGVFAGAGDGKGNGTGYRYSGSLSDMELQPLQDHQDLAQKLNINPGDTVEIHFVYSSARVEPGKTLAACEDSAIINPQLRVEAWVAVLVNDNKGVDLGKATESAQQGGHYQLLNRTFRLGEAVTYLGSTTGPAYNTTPSKYQVTWHVHPKIVKLEALSVLKWLQSNVYDEHHLHGVRNLVTNPELLSEIRADQQGQ
jgi:hypothetical protein